MHLRSYVSWGSLVATVHHVHVRYNVLLYSHNVLVQCTALWAGVVHCMVERLKKFIIAMQLPNHEIPAHMHLAAAEEMICTVTYTRNHPSSEF